LYLTNTPGFGPWLEELQFDLQSVWPLMRSYSYDQLNRLAATSTPGESCIGLSWTYDIWGNLLSATVTQGSAPMLSQSVDANNRVSGYCYDLAGNLLAASAPPCPAPTYSYDAENRMKTAVGVIYTYDGDGKRVQKSTGKLYWYGMASNVLAESDAVGTITDEFIFFDGRRIARRKSTSEVNYYSADHLGTSRVVTNASGTVLDDSDFYPFGGERVVTSASGNTYKFTGKERDAESGLDNFGARYNSPELGRFMSVDPSGVSVKLHNPQTLNRYTYALNNPLAYVDPNGKWSTAVHERIIDNAFEHILSPTERTLLKLASREVDKDQSIRGSYKHGLTPFFGSPWEAEEHGDAFIQENLQKAVQAQMKWENDNWIVRREIGNSADALLFFGQALHTVTDRTSPWHHGSAWGGVLVPGASIGHFLGETLRGPSRQLEIGLAEHEARLLWYRYQGMLAAARIEEEKKRREKRKKRCEEGKPCGEEVPSPW